MQQHSDALGSVSGTLKASRLLNNSLLALLAFVSWSYLLVNLGLAWGKPCLRWGPDGEK